MTTPQPTEKLDWEKRLVVEDSYDGLAIKIIDVDGKDYKYVEQDGLVAFIKDILAQELSKQREEMEKLIDFLESYLDDDECDFDHHGYCQTHYGGDEPGKCRNVEAKNFIKSLTKGTK